MGAICERFDQLGSDDPTRRMRLGLMGGTFDPIHIGHLACAEQVRDAFRLDAVVFVPANVQPFKQGVRLTDPADRLAMVRLATRSNPFFDVSPIEIERGGSTFTVDTLRQLRAHYPDNVELVFITGADAVATLPQWRGADELARLARFVAVSRPGYALDPDVRARLGAIAVDYFEMTALSVSSSNLRAMAAAGRSIRYLTPLPVFDYIQKKGLYR